MRELVRLRQRFIVIIMCSVGLVLTVALIVSVASNFSSQYHRIQNSLAAAQTMERDGDLRPRIGDFSGTSNIDLNTPGDDQGAFSDNIPRIDSVPVYVVEISGETGEATTYGSAAEIDESVLEEALSFIEPDTNSGGLLPEFGLYYSQEITSFGTTRIAFADASHIYGNTLSQGLIALLIWALAMLAFFALSLVLSRMVLKPVEEAWGKQRRFIADASHELKTPLTIILANNNIVQMHPEKTTAEQHQWLESTSEEANRMNDMVTDLLLLAQVENAEGLSAGDEISSLHNGKAARRLSSAHGKVSSVLTSVDLSALVERSLLQFDAVFFERGLVSEAQIMEGLHIPGNKEHIRRLIDILLDNASKYGNRGGSIDVRLEKSTEKAKKVLFSVSNSGALIPPEKITQVFDRFYRVDAAHSDSIPGSGLGLALAQEIVREHGGSIKVSSTPTAKTTESNGIPALDTVAHDEQYAQTTFTVTLPLM